MVSTIHKDKLEKNVHENKEMVFKNGLNNVQTAAYNGTRTVHITKHISRGKSGDKITTSDWSY